MNILVTGGAGFIGSHTLIELYKAGHTAVVVDNLSNSSSEALNRVKTITGKTVPFYKLDIRFRFTSWIFGIGMHWKLFLQCMLLIAVFILPD